MGYGMGWDSNHDRFIGYSVLAYCDHPDCDKEIDRGFTHLCASEDLYGGEHGCGLAFCSEHQHYAGHKKPQACERCAKRKKPFDPKPEHPKWLRHLLTDESWAKWRSENSHEVAATRRAAAAQGIKTVRTLSVFRQEKETR